AMAQADVQFELITPVENPFIRIVLPISRAGRIKPPGLSNITIADSVCSDNVVNTASSPELISPLKIMMSGSPSLLGSFEIFAAVALNEENVKRSSPMSFWLVLDIPQSRVVDADQLICLLLKVAINSPMKDVSTVWLRPD